MVNIIQIIVGAVVSATVAAGAKAFFWVRSALASMYKMETNHLPHMQAAIEAIPVAIEKQTETLSQELKQQREDIRLVLQKL